MYWLSWFLVNVVIVFLSSMVTVVFGLAFGFPVFVNTDFGVLFLLFFVFSLSMITLAFFLTTLVRRVRSAVSAAKRISLISTI